MLSFFSSKGSPKPPERAAPATQLMTPGSMIRGDASGYEVATLEPSMVEKTEYVPFDFARQRVAEVAADRADLKAKYENHATRLKEFYESAIDTQKKHYETYILELKSKASKHADLLKAMKEESDQKFMVQLKESNDEIERLRDSLATLNRYIWC